MSFRRPDTKLNEICFEYFFRGKAFSIQRYTRPNTDRIKAVYRTYHPRENELYEEVTDEYRSHVLALREELLQNKETYRAKRIRYRKGVQ